MCGRFTLRTPAHEIAQAFALFREPEAAPQFNIAPTQPVLAIRFDKDATPREPALLRWGLIPSWAKDPKIGNSLINARADTVATKPSFRTAFKRRRCVIPADGFYEWQAPPTEGKLKQPFHIHWPDGGPFAFGALWEHWDGPDGPLETCAIITTDANDTMRQVHNRMPVILNPEDYDHWLAPGEDTASLQVLLRPADDDLLKLTPVSTRVNNPRNDVPECTEAVDPPWADQT